MLSAVLCRVGTVRKVLCLIGVIWKTIKQTMARKNGITNEYIICGGFYQLN